MTLLKDKITVVSGSSRGIGNAIAYRLLEEGAVVYLTARGEEQLDIIYDDFREKFGDNVYEFNGDLRNTKTILRLIRSIITEHKRLDVVVANIGSGKSKVGWDVEDEFWEESIDMNFYSAVKLARESLRVLMKQKSGNIVFISSIAGCEDISAPVPYSAAKAALLSYMKNTAHLVAPHGIRMNAVSPGNIYFKGGTWDMKMKENPDWVANYIDESVPLQSFGKPGDIADIVCFLASDRASFITGANIIVDGGQTRSL